MFAPNVLQNRVILVTGGGSGLGKAMAAHFLELGASIAICGRRAEVLDAAIEEFEKKTPGAAKRSLGIPADVREFDQVTELVAKIVDRFGTVNGLVNNAAGNFYCTSEDLSPKGFKTVVDIVLHGSFNCSMAVGRHLIDRGEPGAIVNITTTYTQTGSAFVLPSACAKAGVAAMTNSLAYEWAEYGIRVNAIAPGPFPTEGAWGRLVPDADLEKRWRDRVPLKRFGRPEELANVAVFLLSEMSGFITGESITIDGGESLGGAQFNFLATLKPRAELKRIFSDLRAKRA